MRSKISLASHIEYDWLGLKTNDWRQRLSRVTRVA